MKQLILRFQIAFIVMLVALQSASAAYFGASVGYLTDNEEEIFSAQLGMEIASSEKLSHDVELEIAYTSYSEELGSIDITPFMANYKLRLAQSEKVGVYLGGGIGFSLVDVSVLGQSDDDWVFTFQLLAGVEIPFTETVSARIGYRYVYLEDSEFFDVELDELDDSVLEVGLMFKF
jgi:opacity protein-like surface antigen